MEDTPRGQDPLRSGLAGIRFARNPAGTARRSLSDNPKKRHKDHKRIYLDRERKSIPIVRYQEVHSL